MALDRFKRRKRIDLATHEDPPAPAPAPVPETEAARDRRRTRNGGIVTAAAMAAVAASALGAAYFGPDGSKKEGEPKAATGPAKAGTPKAETPPAIKKEAKKPSKEDGERVKISEALENNILGQINAIKVRLEALEKKEEKDAAARQQILEAQGKIKALEASLKQVREELARLRGQNTSKWPEPGEATPVPKHMPTPESPETPKDRWYAPGEDSKQSPPTTPRLDLPESKRVRPPAPATPKLNVPGMTPPVPKADMPPAPRMERPVEPDPEKEALKKRLEEAEAEKRRIEAERKAFEEALEAYRRQRESERAQGPKQVPPTEAKPETKPAPGPEAAPKKKREKPMTDEQINKGIQDLLRGAK